MFSAIGGAYYLLRQVKGKYKGSSHLFSGVSKNYMKKLAKAPFDDNDKAYLKELGMQYIPADNEEENARRAVLAMNNAFELIAVWDWLYRLEHGLNSDEYLDEINFFGSELSRLIRAVDDHPSSTLMGTRELAKSVGAQYYAHKDACEKYVDTDHSDSAYRVRTNLVFKYYLNIPMIYAEETEDGISGTN